MNSIMTYRISLKRLMMISRVLMQLSSWNSCSTLQQLQCSCCWRTWWDSTLMRICAWWFGRSGTGCWGFWNEAACLQHFSLNMLFLCCAAAWVWRSSYSLSSCSCCCCCCNCNCNMLFQTSTSLFPILFCCCFCCCCCCCSLELFDWFVSSCCSLLIPSTCNSASSHFFVLTVCSDSYMCL